jgi:hypothetical protein
MCRSIVSNDVFYACIFFLISVCLSVLSFTALVSPQEQTVTISKPTPSLFAQLYHDYGETLSCPCSTITVPYNTFVSNLVSFHPICSSIFVRREWVEAFYLPLPSVWYVVDFRTTAFSQVCRQDNGEFFL